MKNALRILFALSYFFFEVALAQTQQAYVKPPVPPVFEVCKTIEVVSSSGTKVPQQDPACVQRNADLQLKYEIALNVYNRQKQMMSADAKTLTKPVEPIYADCRRDNGSGVYTYDSGCQSHNAQLKYNYDIQITAWDQVQQDQNSANAKAASLEAQAMAEVKQKQSAAAALAEAQAKAKAAQEKSRSAASSNQNTSMMFGLGYTVSCAGFGACDWKLLAASIAFSMMSSQNGRQADFSANQAHEACVAQSQISSSSVSCGSTPLPEAALSPAQALKQNFDANGRCVSNDKSIQCAAILAALPPGTSMKDVIKGVDAYAKSPPYKLNADGSVTLANGKKLSADDFNNLNALKAAGLTPEQAQAAMGAFGKAAKNAGLKKDLNNANDKSSGFNGFSVSAVGETGANAEPKNETSIQNMNQRFSEQNMEGSRPRRSPAGEGLTRDFNGESIGAAGDDIFSMMNRRYKMKTAQDSFMNQ